MPWQDIPTYPTCFVCGEQNPIGLRMKFRGDGAHIEADFEPQPYHCGYEGIVHGGIVSTVLDEGMGWTAWLTTGLYYLTMELKVRFRAPVRAGTKYLLCAEMVKKKGQVYFTKGALLDPEGTAVAEAEGTYFLVEMPT